MSADVVENSEPTGNFDIWWLAISEGDGAPVEDGAVILKHGTDLVTLVVLRSGAVGFTADLDRLASESVLIDTVPYLSWETQEQ